MIINLTLLVSVASILTISYPQFIDSAQYIWVEYGTVSLQTQDSDYARLSIPCKARIGQCSYSYYQLPLGWRNLPNGDLLIPKRDTEGIKSFAITAKLSEPTGEEIDANMILDVQFDEIKILDQSNFYSSYSYQPPDFSSLLKFDTNKPQNPIPPQTSEQSDPQQITAATITTQQLRQILRSGSSSKVSQALNKVNQYQGDCYDKRRYFQQALDVIKIQISRNDAQVELFNQEIRRMERELERLQLQRKSQKTKSQNEEIKQKIRALETQKREASNRQEKNQQIAANYLQQIKQANKVSQQQNSRNGEAKPKPVQQPQPIDFSTQLEEKELQMVNSAIEEFVDLKQQLQRKISSRKLSKFNSNLPNNFDSLVENYWKYRNIEIQHRLQAEFIEYEIQSLKAYMGNSNNPEILVEEYIKKLEEQIEAEEANRDRSQIEQIEDMIELLKNHEQKYNASINQLKSQCAY